MNNKLTQEAIEECLADYYVQPVFSSPKKEIDLACALSDPYILNWAAEWGLHQLDDKINALIIPNNDLASHLWGSAISHLSLLSSDHPNIYHCGRTLDFHSFKWMTKEKLNVCLVVGSLNNIEHIKNTILCFENYGHEISKLISLIDPQLGLLEKVISFLPDISISSCTTIEAIRKKLKEKNELLRKSY